LRDRRPCRFRLVPPAIAGTSGRTAWTAFALRDPPAGWQRQSAARAYARRPGGSPACTHPPCRRCPERVRSAEAPGARISWPRCRSGRIRESSTCASARPAPWPQTRSSTLALARHLPRDAARPQAAELGRPSTPALPPVPRRAPETSLAARARRAVSCWFATRLAQPPKAYFRQERSGFEVL